jgi:hypothetical protein
MEKINYGLIYGLSNLTIKTINNRRGMALVILLLKLSTTLGAWP